MIFKIKVPQLRKRAEKLGLETKGRKAELIDLINKHLEKLIINKINKRKKNQDNSDEENRKQNKTKQMVLNNLCKNHIIAKCKCKCFLLYHNTNDNVLLYKSVTEHNDHQKLTDHGISPQFQKYIESVYDIYPKLGQMKRYLTYSNLDKKIFPTDQLKNYLSYKKKKLGMKSHLNLGEFEQWCLKHEKIPEDPDEMFVKFSFTVEPKTHKVCTIYMHLFI
jgi:hypothetical protein